MGVWGWWGRGRQIRCSLSLPLYGSDSHRLRNCFASGRGIEAALYWADTSACIERENCHDNDCKSLITIGALDGERIEQRNWGLKRPSSHSNALNDWSPRAQVSAVLLAFWSTQKWTNELKSASILVVLFLSVSLSSFFNKASRFSRPLATNLKRLFSTGFVPARRKKCFWKPLGSDTARAILQKRELQFCMWVCYVARIFQRPRQMFGAREKERQIERKQTETTQDKNQFSQEGEKFMVERPNQVAILNCAIFF